MEKAAKLLRNEQAAFKLIDNEVARLRGIINGIEEQPSGVSLRHRISSLLGHKKAVAAVCNGLLDMMVRVAEIDTRMG